MPRLTAKMTNEAERARLGIPEFLLRFAATFSLDFVLCDSISLSSDCFPPFVTVRNNDLRPRGLHQHRSPFEPFLTRRRTVGDNNEWLMDKT